MHTYHLSPKLTLSLEASRETNDFLAVSKTPVIFVKLPESYRNGNQIVFKEGIVIFRNVLIRTGQFVVPFQSGTIYLVGRLEKFRPPLKLQVYRNVAIDSLVNTETLLTSDGQGFLFSLYPFNINYFVGHILASSLAFFGSFMLRRCNVNNQENITILEDSLDLYNPQVYLNGLKLTLAEDFVYRNNQPLTIRLLKQVDGKLTCFLYKHCKSF